MERFRPKRSKISGIPDFNSNSDSDDTFFSNQRPFSLQPQGNRHVKNPRNFKKLASDSSSCSSGTADDDSFTFELGLRSSKQALGTPMKKLLAKEMSKEMESKRRSPSVIAKLMGLDGLPTQQSVYREEKGISESYLQTTRSSEKGQRNCHSYNNRSSRKSSKDEQEFKDVFEVTEPSKIGSCSRPRLQGTENSNLTDAEMAFIRQKFIDAKRLSTDEKLQNSKEFHEALEVLDSNKDLLLKFLQQPDSLFTKHLHDLQEATPQPLCGRIAAIKSSEPQMYGNAHLRSKSGREPLHRNRTASSQKHRDRRPCQSDCFVAQNSLKSSKSELERKGESTTQPTRIVVLKPNLGKVLNATNNVSSPCSSHASLSESRKDGDMPLSRNREVEVLGRRKFQRDGGISGHKSRESRELAKEITRQMRNSFSNNSSPKFPSTAFKGYAGDESSCSMSGNESANELDVMSTSSKYSFNLNNHSRPLSSRSTESSVSREAKKRLSERWKLTHKPQDMGAVSRGSTLADMLAIDKERRPVHLDGVTDAEGFRNKSPRDDRPAGWAEPLGISSRDGWKDGHIAGLTRSRSLPSSSTVFGSPKAFMRREPIREDRYVIPKETFNRERIKAQKSNLDKRSVDRNSRSNSKKAYHSDYTIRESNVNSPKTHTVHNQVDIELEFSSPPEKKLEEVEASACNITDRSPVPKTLTVVEHEATISSETLDNSLPEPAFRTLVTDVCDADGHDDLNLQEPPAEPREESPLPANHSAPGLESPASSKEADQPSPVSVLEVPFTDDLSSCSECFESLSADLQGLRMQLKLLKLESESYEEGDILISSDEDVGEGSYATGLHRSPQSWEFCYVVDVLLHSGLDDADPDVFLAAWHTPEYPISPLAFEELEKKNYAHQATQPKSERRLLFDRINAGILEMYRQFTDPHPWVRSATEMFGPRWSKNQLQDGLIRLLASQEKNAKKETAEKVLGSEEQWLDIRGCIDVIGGEFQKLLLDELLEELLEATVV